MDGAAARVEDELGPIDVWVNNAMTTVFAFFDDVEPGEFRRATEVTYLGTVWGTMAALRRMAPRNRGTIVQVGSALAAGPSTRSRASRSHCAPSYGTRGRGCT